MSRVRIEVTSSGYTPRFTRRDGIEHVVPMSRSLQEAEMVAALIAVTLFP